MYNFIKKVGNLSIVEYLKTRFNLSNIEKEDVNMLQALDHTIRGMSSEYKLLNVMFNINSNDINNVYSNFHERLWLHEYNKVDSDKYNKYVTTLDYLFEIYPTVMQRIYTKQMTILKLKFKLQKVLITGPQSCNDFLLVQALCFGMTGIEVADALLIHEFLPKLNQEVKEYNNKLYSLLKFLGYRLQENIKRHIFGIEPMTNSAIIKKYFFEDPDINEVLNNIKNKQKKSKFISTDQINFRDIMKTVVHPMILDEKDKINKFLNKSIANEDKGNLKNLMTNEKDVLTLFKKFVNFDKK